jgi:hypothetical protein
MVAIETVGGGGISAVGRARGGSTKPENVNPAKVTATPRQNTT